VRNARVLSTVSGLILAAAVLAGCGPEKTIEIHYQRQAEYEISPRITRLAIAPFNGKTALSRQWAQIASDRLEAALDEYNRKYKRYQLIDRKRLKQILDARDVKLFVSDDSSASKLGKLADVHAMIYGNVRVAASDDRVSRKTFDIRTRAMKTVYYTRRHAIAAVTFTLNDTATGKTLTTVSASHEYDSDKDPKGEGEGESIAKLLGVGGDQPLPAEKIFSVLVDRCVADLIARISPHEVAVTEKLSRGKSKLVGTGNKLAAAEDYDEALACYQRAMTDRPDDHGAVFNAGLMYEAKGDLKQAEAHYGRAFKLEPKEQYVFARKRVRVEADK